MKELAETLRDAQCSIRDKVTKLTGKQEMAIYGLIRFDAEGEAESETYEVVLPRLDQAARGGSVAEVVRNLQKKHYLMPGDGVSSKDKIPSLTPTRTDS